MTKSELFRNWSKKMQSETAKAQEPKPIDKKRLEFKKAIALTEELKEKMKVMTNFYFKK